MNTQRGFFDSLRLCLRVFRGRIFSVGGLIIVGLLLNAGFTVFDPIVTKLLIDKGLVQRNFRLFVFLAVASVGAGIFFRIVSRLYELVSKRSQNQTTITMVLRMLQSYYAADPTKLPDSSPGYFVSRIYDETAAASKAILTTAGGFFVSAATLIAALGLSLYLSWRLTLTLGCVVQLLTLIALRFSPQVSNASQAATEEEARVREHLGRVVEAYRTVKIFSLQRFATLTTSARLQRSLSSGYEKTRVSKTYEMASQILFSLAEASVFVGCGYAVVKGYLTLGALFALMSSFWKVMNSGRALVAQYPELIAFLAQVERISEFESLPKDVEALAPRRGLAELEHLRVSYGEKEVLSDFSLEIGAGQKVLLLGANGTGKSTLAKTLTGFVAQQEGVVRQIGREHISALITPFFFVPGSLEEHVGFENLSSAKKATFQTLVQEFGLSGKCEADIALSFSEGEKKKAQIIMTLIRDANLYILDEPLAHLDTQSKEVAMQWIIRLAKDKALLVIMHGEEQYHRHFDRVVSLGAGRDGRVATSLAMDTGYHGSGKDSLALANLGDSGEIGCQSPNRARSSSSTSEVLETIPRSHAPLQCSLSRQRMAMTKNRGLRSSFIPDRVNSLV